MLFPTDKLTEVNKEFTVSLENGYRANLARWQATQIDHNNRSSQTVIAEYVTRIYAKI